MSLGRLWNNLHPPAYTKKNHYNLTSLTELRKKAVVFLCQNLIRRCFLTILVEIYGDPIFFGSGPVLSIGRNPIQVLLIRSDPVRVLSIRSDPIRSRFCKRPARVTFRVMKLGRYVTVDDGGNYVMERSHKDKKNNNNSSQRELGPPVFTIVMRYSCILPLS